MKITILCFLLFVAGASAYGDINALFEVLKHPVEWQQRTPSGNWLTVSGNPKIISSKDKALVFGFQPQRILAFYEGTQISQVVIVYLETGYNLNLWQKVADTQNRNFEASFDRTKTALLTRLEQLMGQKGTPVKLTAGAENFVFDMTEYRVPDLVFRLYAEDKKLICLSVCRTADASASLLRPVSLDERRATLARNVERKLNGDVLIRNLPVLDQDGRPYCGPATWTEIGRYYGLNVYQEMMVSGGREGGNGVKEAAQLTQTYEKAFDFAKVQKSIDSGNLVWFSAPGHVALISGYNKNLNTIFRTDSWGEGSRNKRVPLAQFTKEANGFMYFQP